MNNRFNSTNASRSMNNVPVPMDIDRTRFNQNRPTNQGYQNTGGRVANAGPIGQNRRTPNPSVNAPCFKCGAMDHWANKCPNRRGQFNLINFNPNSPEEPQMSIDEIKERINAMTLDEKGALANSIENQEQDFLTV